MRSMVLTPHVSESRPYLLREPGLLHYIMSSTFFYLVANDKISLGEKVWRQI
jgi:hypothetical protein